MQSPLQNRKSDIELLAEMPERCKRQFGFQGFAQKLGSNIKISFRTLLDKRPEARRDANISIVIDAYGAGQKKLRVGPEPAVDLHGRNTGE
jgi:hypothetical protein